MVESGKFCFFGVPTSEGALGKNKGCENAPKYLAELLNINLTEFSLPKNDVEEQQNKTFAFAKSAFVSCKNCALFFFGGTHDITFSTFKAFAQVHKDASILIFDAHADCDEGLSVVSHEDFVRALVEQKIVASEQILLFGLRKVYPSEKSFLKSSGVKQIYLKEINSNPKRVFSELNSFIKNSKNLYVSFDVDVLDSEIMKATGYVHKGGLSGAQTKKFLSLVLKKSRGFDLVEFNPKKSSPKEDKLIKSLFSF
ncbi:MAG: arginase family protein [archaeon]